MQTFFIKQHRTAFPDMQLQGDNQFVCPCFEGCHLRLARYGHNGIVIPLEYGFHGAHSKPDTRLSDHVNRAINNRIRLRRAQWHDLQGEVNRVIHNYKLGSCRTPGAAGAISPHGSEGS